MKTRIALIVACALFAQTAGADEPETKRDVIVEKRDVDGNKRLDGKEMKTLKKENPKMYESLMDFCDKANETPKKMGVDLPADPSKEQLQCKKKHVSRLFLNAWTANGAPVEPTVPASVDSPPRSDDGRAVNR